MGAKGPRRCDLWAHLRGKLNTPIHQQIQTPSQWVALGGRGPPPYAEKGGSCGVVSDAVSVMLSSTFPGAVDFECRVDGEVANSVESVWCEGGGGVTCVEEVSFERGGVLSEEVHDECFIVRGGEG
jgi:hypothetical protein